MQTWLLPVNPLLLITNEVKFVNNPNEDGIVPILNSKYYTWNII